MLHKKEKRVENLIGVIGESLEENRKYVVDVVEHLFRNLNKAKSQLPFNAKENTWMKR